MGTSLTRAAWGVVTLDTNIIDTQEQLALGDLSEAILDEEAQRSDLSLPVLHEVIEELAETVSTHRCVGVILVDTNNLGPWERRHGAAAFTALMGRLSSAAVQMKGESVRGEDVISLDRAGGDTILLFLSQPRNEEALPGVTIDLEEVMERFKRELFEPFATAQMIYHQALDMVSMGSALILHNSSVDPRREIYRAIRRARTDAAANYTEMQRRRHRVVGHMIAQRKIETVYQPIVTLKGRGVVGYEALSRADAQDAARLGVHLFVAASRAELDGELDQACRSLSIRRRPTLSADMKLFINCLPPTFYEPNRELTGLIERWLDEGHSPDQLVFEVTEQITHDQALRIMPTIERLRQEGFLFALDDVGTGAANLRLLAELEPEYIKMDIGLTVGISESERKQELASYLLELARKSEAKLIAEGIETDEDLKTLVDLGVELGQGYLLGRPAAAKEWLAIG